MWRCPVCRLPLFSGASAYRCGRGHAFDVARSGYVNLLLGHRRGSATRGDNSEMIRSRRLFLEEGHYAPLRRLLGQLEVSHLVAPTGRSPRLLDTGCGEGYFTDALARHLGGDTRAPSVEVFGIDVSRYAVNLAAQRYRHIRFAVASVRQLPVITGAVDSLLSVLAPRNGREFARVLSSSGRLLVVKPGPDHLIELRRLLYTNLRPPGPRHFAGELRSLQLLDEQRLVFPVLLENPDQAARLLAMTPYAWTAGAAIRGAALGLSGAPVTADFLVTAHGQRR